MATSTPTRALPDSPLLGAVPRADAPVAPPPSGALGYTTREHPEVLGAGMVASQGTTPTPVEKRPKGRFAVAGLLTAIVAWAAFTFWDAFLRFSGHGIVVGRLIEISPPFEGELEFVYAVEGERVAAGQVVASVRNHELERERDRLRDLLRVAEADLAAEVARARWQADETHDRLQKAQAEYYESWGELLAEQARLDSLRQELERLRRLDANGLTTKARLAEAGFAFEGQMRRVGKLAQAVEELRGRSRASVDPVADGRDQLAPALQRIELLKGDLARVTTRLAEGQVTAPVSGRVLRRAAFAGERATASASLFTLLEDASLAIELYVDPDDVAPLAIGRCLAVEVAGQEEPVRCRIREIGPALVPLPASLGRFHHVHEERIPVLAEPLETGGAAAPLRVGALVRMP